MYVLIYSPFCFCLFVCLFVYFFGEAIDFCAGQNPCQNGRECERTREGYYCKCEIGFAGKACENSKLLHYKFLYICVKNYQLQICHTLNSTVAQESVLRIMYNMYIEAKSMPPLIDSKTVPPARSPLATPPC